MLKVWFILWAGCLFSDVEGGIGRSSSVVGKVFAGSCSSGWFAWYVWIGRIEKKMGD
jgi:hypothetical protein